MNHRQRTTLAAFLAYAVMSGMLAPIGLLSPELAATFDLSITDVTRRFGWLTIGILVGAVLAVELTPRIGLRPLLTTLYVVAAVALVSLRLPLDTDWVWPALGLVGVTSGIGLSAAALTIARSYQRDQRASMLVITDGCFSLAGVGISLFAGYAIASGWHWSSTYLLVGFVALVIAILCAVSRFPEAPEPSASASVVPWPRSAWASIAALFLYTLGQNAITWWLPQHMRGVLGASDTEAGSVVANYWLGMLFAQLFVAWFVYRIGLNRLLGIAVCCCVAASVPLWLLTDRVLVVWMALLFGFLNLGFLKLMISFASEKLPTPTPRLISSLLLGATTGTALSPAITSQIVEWTSVGGVLRFASVCFAVMAFLVLAMLWRNDAPTEISHAN